MLVFLTQLLNLLLEVQVLCFPLRHLAEVQGRNEFEHLRVLAYELVAHHCKGVIVLFQIGDLFVDLLEILHQLADTLRCSAWLTD